MNSLMYVNKLLVVSMLLARLFSTAKAYTVFGGYRASIVLLWQ